MADVIAASGPGDWRVPDPANTLYLQLAAGRVIIELAADFAPQHAENIKTLVREGYFDGLAIIRSQDNFVVQWGDADGGRPIKSAKTSVPPEFTVAQGGSLPFTRLPDPDGYAPEVGFPAGSRRRAIRRPARPGSRTATQRWGRDAPTRSTAGPGRSCTW